MAEWQTPKTDWRGEIDKDGIYQGDRFNYVDFNRIKNNLTYLRDLAVKIYPEFNIDKVSDDKTYSDFPYADEFNTIENNLDVINSKTLKRNYGDKQEFEEYGVFIDFNELNRIEGAELDLYENLTNGAQGRRAFTWNFEEKGGTL